MMKTGLGVLLIPPKVFWTMTLEEYLAASIGWTSFHAALPEPDPMTREQMDDMLEDFPDGPLDMNIRRKHAASKSKMVH